ncbi:sugar ABC transporter ATP-binding protein [Clostridium sp. SYSU_GA19001]|uniref:sugar ABC transporter ATP-binding protein n=1 Tax=Clostridium caldaquaticum TaxID=2940653 RepID=UPI00207759E5|nr:sugar ABC transporter ATP-binding protein [Clostridium caldaquaticum]MCM8712087.1 sugar ABC transporter ATP-binding protein [Clostridium caldaquaticum]
MDNVILRMENIHKRFPGVYALCGVNFELRYGEVHALLGENGAGKSTLIKVLAGIHPVDEGSIYIKGEKRNIDSVKASQANGISVIHQELCLVPHMTVSENIFLGREKLKGKFKAVDKIGQNRKAQEILNSLGLEIKATDMVAKLSVAQQQMVEIAKALSVDSEIIVMDEPTSSLSEKEVDMLFKTIDNLKKRNIAIIYISHRMEELYQITDRITVMRDGKYIGTRETKDVTMDELISMMVGRELKDLYIRNFHELGEKVFEVKNLSRDNVLNNISFSLNKGEILGIAGLVGAGRTELARAIFGVDSFKSGKVIIEGKEVTINSPQDAMNNGIVLVPESRKEQGLILIKSVGYNITLCVLNEFMKTFSNDKHKEESIISDYINKLSIKTPSSKQLVGNLSGGNQQKIVIAKWLATKPKVLILDEPTRGVDVVAKAEIYSIIDMLSNQGVSIIMISSDLPEVTNMSDRVMVMCRGEIAGILERKDITQERIMKLATGGAKHAS